MSYELFAKITKNKCKKNLHDININIIFVSTIKINNLKT